MGADEVDISKTIHPTHAGEVSCHNAAKKSPGGKLSGLFAKFDEPSVAKYFVLAQYLCLLPFRPKLYNPRDMTAG